MLRGLQHRKRLLSGLLLFFMGLSSALAQSQPVRGKVTDAETGDPLPGVSIAIKGTSTGTTSDGNGEYSIVLPEEKGTLIFSFIGYVPEEIEVTGGSTANISLTTDITSLQEVVVVGYGTQKKTHVTGAVASANMDNFSRVPTGNALDALQGQVAGVNISTTSGNPAAAPAVQIRGIGTINGTSPLYVIDGMPSDVNFINPSEIESINVLKDASAATIYGARGANGVILITTKRGKAGLPQVTFNTFVGVHQVSNLIEPASRAERNTLLINSFTNAGLTPPTYTNSNVQGQYADTDWVDAYFKTGVEQKYDVSIAGGTDQVSYNVMGGYYRHNGTVVNSGLNRYNMRLNLDFKNLLKNRLNINTGVAFIRKDIKNFTDVGDVGNAGFSSIMYLYQTLPHKAIYDANSVNGYAGQDASLGLSGAGNIIGERNLFRDESQNDYLQLNASAELKIIDGLTYKFGAALNAGNNYNDQFAPEFDFGPGAQFETPRTWQSRSRDNYSILNNTLTFSKEINNHAITVLAGQSSEHYIYKSTGASNLELPSSRVEALNAGIGTRDATGSIAENTLLSYFARASYSYNEKYFLEGSLRKDGSSRFGPANRWGTFYGISGGWALHRENFYSLEAISELKPRASYGVVGNQNIGDFLFQSLIASGGSTLNYPFGVSPSPAALPGAISVMQPNPNVKWEETKTQNYGLDLGLLENNLSITFDYYKSKTIGMLVESLLPGTAGVQVAPVTNIGDLENKGFEVGVTYRKQRGEFTYSINGNVGTSKNKITQLGFEGQEFIQGFVEFNNYATTRTTVGSQIGEFYLYEVAGIFQTQAEIDAYKNSDGALIQPNAAPGDFKFVDIDGDGEFTEKDKRSFGSALPKAFFALNLNATWKNFDVQIAFNGTAGNKMYNGLKMQSYRLGFSRDLLDSWTPQNTGSDIPRLDRNDPNNNYSTASNYFLENASYVRLRNLQIGYTLPTPITESLGINRLRFYVGGYNLLTFTKYTGFDPGLSNFGKLSRGVDRGYYPMSRSFVGGLTLVF